jgi:hypothetical protein
LPQKCVIIDFISDLKKYFAISLNNILLLPFLVSLEPKPFDHIAYFIAPDNQDLSIIKYEPKSQGR